jgi:exonuclease III
VVLQESVSTDRLQTSTNIPELLNNVKTGNLTYIKTVSPFINSTTGSLCLDFSLINSRSICNKSRIIQDFIIDHDIDILAVTETWLRGDEYDHYPVRDVCPVGYSLYHTPRLDMRGGGVGVVMKNTFNVTNHTNGTYQFFEHIELLFKLSTAPVRLVVLYRPPGVNISTFLDEFANYLEYISTSPGYLLLAGDFNIHVD